MSRIKKVEDELREIHKEALRISTRHGIKVNTPNTQTLVRDRSMTSMNQYLTQQMQAEILQVLATLDQMLSLSSR